eukprot:UN12420
MINNVQYFNVRKGYGIHIPITNIIEILSVTTIMLELKETLHILQEKMNYIQDLESIINSKKNYLPRRRPKLVLQLTNINVDLPPSERNTFILPAPITPITPNTPNTPNSINSFPLISSYMPDISRSRENNISEPQSPSISLTQSVSPISDTFSSSCASSREQSSSDIPSTPIT